MYNLKTIKQFLNEGLEDQHSELVDSIELLIGKVKSKKKLKIYKDEFNGILDEFDEAYEEDDNRQMNELVGELKDLLKTIKKSVNESLNEAKNSSMSYPLRNEKEAERMLSGRSAGRQEVKKKMTVLDVFGEEQLLFKGDILTVYLQVWSTDDSMIYVKHNKDRYGKTLHTYYIPSSYRGNDQGGEIEANTIG